MQIVREGTALMPNRIERFCRRVNGAPAQRFTNVPRVLEARRFSLCLKCPDIPARPGVSDEGQPQGAFFRVFPRRPVSPFHGRPQSAACAGLFSTGACALQTSIKAPRFEGCGDARETPGKTLHAVRPQRRFGILWSSRCREKHCTSSARGKLVIRLSGAAWKRREKRSILFLPLLFFFRIVLICVRSCLSSEKYFQKCFIWMCNVLLMRASFFSFCDYPFFSASSQYSEWYVVSVGQLALKK